MIDDQRERLFIYGPHDFVLVYTDGKLTGDMRHASADQSRKVLTQLGYTVKFRYKPDELLVSQFIECAKYDGPCAMNSDHRIRAGARAVHVVRADSSRVGYACATCDTEIQAWWHDPTDEDV